MKSIKDLTEDECIHAPTREIAAKLCYKFNELGLKWRSNISYLNRKDWSSFEENTVYYPTKGTYGSVVTAKELDCKIYTIDQLADFQTLEINKDFLEELYGFASGELRTQFEKLYPDVFGAKPSPEPLIKVSIERAKKIVAKKYGTNPENITIN